MLAFSSHNIQYRLSIFLISWRTVNFLPKLDRLPPFYHSNSPCCETPPRAPSMWTFFQGSRPLGHHHPFHHNRLCPWACLCRLPPAVSAVLNGGTPNIPTVVSSNFTFGVLTFHFPGAFPSLSANSLFWPSVFVQCRVGLFLGDKRATPHMLCYLPVSPTTDGWWPITHRQPLKEVTWQLTDRDVRRFFTQWSEHRRAGSRVCALCNYSRLIHRGTEIRTVLWKFELCCHLTKPWQPQSMHSRTMQSENCLYIQGRAILW